MALPTSGAIKLSEIQSEFGGTNPVSLSEYYSGGSFVPASTSGVPASGEISVGDFYGASNQYSFSISSDTQSADIRALAVSDGWDGQTPLVANINAGTTLYSNSTSTGGAVVAGSFPGGLTIVNSGNITGQGGGAGSDGGPALQVTTSDTVSITNNSGAFIAGGGGGGGGSQGGGGAGQAAPGQAGAAGGAYTSSQVISSYVQPYGCSEGGVMSGTLSCSVTVSGVAGAGGNQGASAGSGTTTGGSCYATTTLTNTGHVPGYTGPYCNPIPYSGTLSGGGGTPNYGGQGGSILSSSQNQTVSGGGWGLAGAGGGAGGAAISGTVTLTNNGTIYGATS